MIPGPCPGLTSVPSSTFHVAVEFASLIFHPVRSFESQIPTSRKKPDSVRRGTLVAVCSSAKGAGKQEREKEERGRSESGSTLECNHDLIQEIGSCNRFHVAHTLLVLLIPYVK